jgi:3-mercaptopyruvate sulfurtransferase SseA
MTRLKIVPALLALLALAACQGTNGSQVSGDASIPATAADVPRMRVKELKALLDAGQEIIIADARSLAAYEESHIAGAISLPLLEVDKRHKELPRDAKIVLYCT